MPDYSTVETYGGVRAFVQLLAGDRASDADQDAIRDWLDAGGTLAHLASLTTGYVPVAGTYALATTQAQGSKVTGDAVERWTRDAAGKMSWGGGAGAVDTNLYRGAADYLYTDDGFYAGADIRANRGGAGEVRIGGSSLPMVQFGNSADTTVERTGVGVVGVTNYLQVVREVNARQGAAGLVSMGAVGPSSEAGLQFGSALDTNLYRSAADTLKTDDNMVANSFTTAGAVTAYSGTGQQSALSTGYDGTSVFYPKWTSSKGSVHLGDVAPIAGLGSNGDFYLRSGAPGTALARIYVKSAGAWTGIL